VTLKLLVQTELGSGVIVWRTTARNASRPRF